MIFISNQDKNGEFDSKKSVKTNSKPFSKPGAKPFSKSFAKPGANSSSGSKPFVKPGTNSSSNAKPAVKPLAKGAVDVNKFTNTNNNDTSDTPTFRLRLPRGKREFIGLVEQRLGGSRMRVKCFDGKVRICRIPGRLKRRLWIRENDIVIVESWEIQGDEKGDVIYKYNRNQVPQLKSGGYLKEIEDYEEF